MKRMKKVKIYYTAEIITSVPYDSITLLLVSLVCFRVFKNPDDMKVCDNKKIKLTKIWTTFSPLSTLFLPSRPLSMQDTPSKQTEH